MKTIKKTKEEMPQEIEREKYLQENLIIKIENMKYLIMIEITKNKMDVEINK